MTTLILREDLGPIARLTLNTPASLNALSGPMIAALQSALDRLAEDAAVRVVILRGAGRAFCAGHDLREITAARAAPDGGEGWFRDLFGACSRMMQTLPALPQPVIAQVHGLAAAAGCQLVAACDMAVAAEGTRFGVNGVNIGLFCSTPMVALTRAIPPKAAFEMLSTGEFIDAARARALGLINRTAAPEALDDATLALAQTLAAKLPVALRMGKAAFHAQLGLSLAEAYAQTCDTITCNLMQPDTAEGIAAFLEKRPPNWG